MNIRRVFFVICAAFIFAGGLYAGDTSMKAYKTNIWNEYVQHTYFCLDNTSDCHSITGWGITSTKSGGTYIPYTYAPVGSRNRCRARYHASNSAASPCYILYGITGVCHTQTNRGLYVGDKTIGTSQSRVGGSWASWIAYGTHGLPAGYYSWTACKTTALPKCCSWNWWKFRYEC